MCFVKILGCLVLIAPGFRLAGAPVQGLRMEISLVANLAYLQILFRFVHVLTLIEANK